MIHTYEPYVQNILTTIMSYIECVTVALWLECLTLILSSQVQISSMAAKFPPIT